MRIALFTGLVAGLCLFSIPAFAHNADGDGEPSDGIQDAPAAQAAAAREGAARLTIGIGVARLPDYEGSNEHRLSPIPVANGTVAGMSFTVLGNRLSLDLIPDRAEDRWNLQVGPIAVLNLNRTDRKAIDDTRVAALGDVDTAVEVGGFIGVGKTGLITSDFDTMQVSLSYRHDVTKIHKSGIWQPSINYTTPLSTKALVGFFASAEIVEDRYARTYFGVTPRGSVVSGLPIFTPTGGQKDISFGGMFTHSLTGNLTKGLALVVGGQYKKLLGDFADSPIVSIAGSRHQWTAGAGVAMTF